MKCRFLFILVLFELGILIGQSDPGSFVKFPSPVAVYLERIQQGRQEHAFKLNRDFAKWQESARIALVELIGLKQIRDGLVEFRPRVIFGKRDHSGHAFTRQLCSIETEPGVKVPFYLLTPLSASPDNPAPVFLAPHGHDLLGLHSYAGVFKTEEHRKKVMSKDGNIAEQAAKRGFIAIAPATRGLASEVSIPDLKGRHGNRSCRAQLMHCLVAGRTPVAERVWDMQCLLDWIVKHPAADPMNIVMCGNSGGGVLTTFTAAIDERIKIAVPSCSFAPVTAKGGYIFHCDCCMVPGIRNWGDWTELGGLIAPRGLLIVHGVEDGLHHRPTVEKVFGGVQAIYKSAGTPGHVLLKWGASGHRFYPTLMWPFIEQYSQKAGW